jgi:GNAT superfamily N-acetyltransferase
MHDITIENLSGHIDFIPLLAQWHFKQWGDLTGALTESGYEALFFRHASAQEIPLTLVAVEKYKLLGSVNIVECDMSARSELKPRLPQLYVHLRERRRGIGSTLVHAAVAQTRKLGFDYLYLFTSGTLPSFYERLGWTTRETVYYKGKDRTMMETKLVG